MNSQLNLLLGLVKMEILLFIWLVLAASFEIRPENNRPPATFGFPRTQAGSLVSCYIGINAFSCFVVDERYKLNMDGGDLAQGEGGADDRLEGDEVEGVEEDPSQEVTGLNEGLWLEVQRGLQEVKNLLSGESNDSASQHPSEESVVGARESVANALAGELMVLS